MGKEKYKKLDLDKYRIGQNIQYIRKAAGIKAADFAIHLHISEETLKKIESGQYPHSYEPFIQMVAKLVEPQTGITDYDIRKGNLSYLEKRSWTFDRVIPNSELINDVEVKEFVLEELDLFLPRVIEEKDKDFPLFMEAYQALLSLNKKLLQEPTVYGQEYLDVLVKFENAYKQNNKCLSAAANYLSCFGYLYWLFVENPLDLNNIEEFSSQETDNAIDYQAILENAKKSREETTNRCKEELLKGFNGILTHYMVILRNSHEYSDYAYHFLCVRYIMGMLDEKITHLTKDEMHKFGMSMLDCLSKMGNKYAKALDDFLNN